MASTVYSAPLGQGTAAGIAVPAAGAAKSMLAVINPANIEICLTEICLGLSGGATTDAALRVELCKSTQAGAGTSSAVTPVLAHGKDLASAGGVTAAKNYTVEPTVLTAVKEYQLPPGQLLVVQYPLGREPEPEVAAAARALVLRVTTPTGATIGGTVNVGHIEFEL
jgi:surface antigen